MLESKSSIPKRNIFIHDQNSFEKAPGYFFQYLFSKIFLQLFLIKSESALAVVPKEVFFKSSLQNCLHICSLCMISKSEIYLQNMYFLILGQTLL